ncbi:MAG: HIT domain-containing protein [Chloroflexi bacterium]|nr:HIT domain-containing protein [Chloroflexota bacterium]
MEYIWAPWRVAYVRLEKQAGCFLCDKPRETDDTGNYILYRGEKNFVIMNSYPYNPGHLMVCPFRHIATPEELALEELLEHFDIINRAMKALRETLRPEGFNLGMNIGKVAGAGIDTHVHTHIVPRWQGDTNFMPVVSGTKVISEALADTYRQLKTKFG